MKWNGFRPEKSFEWFLRERPARKIILRRLNSDWNCSIELPSDKSNASKLWGRGRSSTGDSLREAGRERTYIVVASLIDTNILVYRFDPRFPEKQDAAAELLRRGLARDTLRIPHQALVEFMAAVTRVPLGRACLLSPDDARRETEELLAQLPVLYPNEALFRTALRGMAAYQLSWFDAHLWAYAEHYGLSEIVSEDFEHGRLYGSVRVMNPFLRKGS
jgi:predicted nucleic acid-binding protein